MKKNLIALVLLLVGLLVVVGCSKSTSQVESEVVEPFAGGDVGQETTQEKENHMPQLVVEDIYVVESTNDGFSPRKLTIKTGDSVQFVAKDGGRHWPASSMHPSHEAYPRSSINKCNGPEEDTVFDACRILQKEQVFEFRFTEKGSWQYHDHLHPALTGTVVVE